MEAWRKGREEMNGRSKRGHEVSCVREGDGEEMVKWRQVIGCGHSRRVEKKKTFVLRHQ